MLCPKGPLPEIATAPMVPWLASILSKVAIITGATNAGIPALVERPASPVTVLVNPVYPFYRYLMLTYYYSKEQQKQWPMLVLLNLIWMILTGCS